MEQLSTEQTIRITTLITENIVDAISPEESAFVGQIIVSLKEQGSSQSADHPLAFGVGEIIQLTTPFAYEAAKALVTFILERLRGSAVDIFDDALKASGTEAKSAIRGALKRMLSPADDHKTLTDAEKIEAYDHIMNTLTVMKAQSEAKIEIITVIQGFSNDN